MKQFKTALFAGAFALATTVSSRSGRCRVPVPEHPVARQSGAAEAPAARLT